MGRSGERGRPLTAPHPRLVPLSGWRQLDLSSHRLAELAGELAREAQLRPPLTHLDLSHNQLPEIPSTLAQLRPLTHLDLSHNQLVGPLDGLAQLSPLRSLHLHGNPLTSCLLPLPWSVTVAIPPSHVYADSDHVGRSGYTPPATRPLTLPFLSLCWE